MIVKRLCNCFEEAHKEITDHVLDSVELRTFSSVAPIATPHEAKVHETVKEVHTSTVQSASEPAGNVCETSKMAEGCVTFLSTSDCFLPQPARTSETVLLPCADCSGF